MIGKARQLYPGMDFRVLDACLMPWNNWFDVIFPMPPSIGYRTTGLF